MFLRTYREFHENLYGIVPVRAFVTLQLAEGGYHELMETMLIILFLMAGFSIGLVSGVLLVRPHSTLY
jgi:hypothetical protein